MKTLKAISLALVAALVMAALVRAVFDASEPPPRTASTARSTPAPAAPASARGRPPYRVLRSPTRPGLGVTRDSIVGLFAGPSLGFTFRERPTLGDGSQSVMGLSENGQVLMELIGSAAEVMEVSVSAEVTGNPRDATMNAIAIAGLLKRIFPNWTGSTDWLTSTMRRAQDGRRTSSHTQNGIPVNFQYHEALGIAVVTIN